MPNSSLFRNDKETISILIKHFHNVHNCKVKVDWKIINKIKPLLIMYKISEPITIDNLNNILKRLSWYKAPVRNGIILSILKALDETNRLILL